MLKTGNVAGHFAFVLSFSALQRAEIAEIDLDGYVVNYLRGFSTLQRVEIAEIRRSYVSIGEIPGFSTLQRVEIAEMSGETDRYPAD